MKKNLKTTAMVSGIILAMVIILHHMIAFAGGEKIHGFMRALHGG